MDTVTSDFEMDTVMSDFDNILRGAGIFWVLYLGENELDVMI